MEYGRIPTSALVNIETGNASSNLVAAVKAVGGNAKPIIAAKIGMNKETYEMEFKILLNGEMAEAVKLAGIEFVNAFIINESELPAVTKMF